jgi:ABC-type oligopeptide transport system ATPase subunit
MVPVPDIQPLVEVRALGKEYPSEDGPRAAVADVSFAIRRGETFGLAGRSSAGKSTIGRMIVGLEQPTAGDVLFEGREISRLPHRERRPFIARMQMVFQNPLAAMNPRRTAAATLDMPLRHFGIGTSAERRDRISELLAMVGLSPRHATYYPHELSGGQCQRLGIARALATSPQFLFLDEPVSALDVSIQAQILNLLKELQERLGLTYLFVANNLNVARFICDRLAVIADGRVVELGDNTDIFTRPAHPATRQLLDSVITVSLSRPGSPKRADGKS